MESGQWYYTIQGAFRAGDAGTIAGFFSEEVTEYLHRRFLIVTGSPVR